MAGSGAGSSSEKFSEVMNIASASVGNDDVSQAILGPGLNVEGKLAGCRVASAERSCSGLDKLRALLTQVSSATEPGRPLAFGLEFFRHVDGHRRLHRALVGREGGTVIDRELRKVLADLIRPELSQSRHQKHDVQLAVQYLVSGIMSTVAWWLDYNVNFSPKEVDQASRRITLPGLRAILQ